jgi:leader peptidase (prepilin peptidase) / N-methyltransferase
VIVAIFAIYGLMVGSFLNVVIYRVPLGLSIIKPPSACPKCGTNIKPWHNIPVLSWLLLKGACPSCSEKISIQYPLVELATMAMFIAASWTIDSIYIAVIVSVTFSMLFAMAVIDQKSKLIPDSINLLALTVSLFAVSSVSGFLGAFESALLCAGFFALARFYGEAISGREILGEADIIIAATIGSLLGWKLAFVAIMLSQVLFVLSYPILKKINDNEEHPMVPWLFAATFLVFIFREEVGSLIATFFFIKG